MARLINNWRCTSAEMARTTTVACLGGGVVRQGWGAFHLSQTGQHEGTQRRSQPASQLGDHLVALHDCVA